MDKTTIAGLLAGIAALTFGFLLEGGELSGLFKGTAALIVFGGTLAAVVISFPFSRLKAFPQALKFAFTKPVSHQDELITVLTEYAAHTRRHGLLSIEKQVSDHPHPFVKEGLLMAIDGADPELIRDILEMEIQATERRHEGYAKLFESAGGYAPTMGIIGTVMGLIQVLGNLTDPSTLGPSIAIAFTATLYGVASANLIYLPIASKIIARSHDEVHQMEMIMEGILSIQAGEHPSIIQKKLHTFKNPEDRLQDIASWKNKVVQHETQD